MLSSTFVFCSVCVTIFFSNLVSSPINFPPFIFLIRMSFKYECYGIITNFVRCNDIVLRIFKNVLLNEIHIEVFTDEISYFKIL